MSYFNPDLPVSGTYNEPDLLNRDPFAKSLAQKLIPDKDDPCLVVSIEGKWGDGKTSFIEILKLKLGNVCDDMLIIDFNPWLVKDAETLVQKFLIQFAACIGCSKDHKYKDLASALLKYTEIFNALKLIPGAEPWASIATGIFKAGSKSISAFSENDRFNILSAKKEVSEAIKKLDKPVFIIIDDIDRLAPDAAYEVIRLVKAVADFPRTVFILAYDPEYLTGVFREKGIPKPTEYIEKIVQARIPLPQTCPFARLQMVNNEFASFLEEDIFQRFPGDDKRFNEIYQEHAKHFLNNPRDIKRIFNHLRIACLSAIGEVCFSDLFALSIIAIKADGIYALIKMQPELFIGKETIFGHSSNADESSEIIKKSCDTSAPNDSTQIKSLVETLFPRTIPSKRTTLTHAVDHSDKLGRVASPDRLFTAMHYGIAKNTISETRIKIMLSNGDSWNTKLNTLLNDSDISRSAIERTWHLISSNVNLLKKGSEKSFLTDIYDSFFPSTFMRNEFYSPTIKFTSLDTPYLIFVTTVDILRSANKKTDTLIFLSKNKNALLPLSEILHRLAAQYGEISPRENEGKEFALAESEDQYHKFKEAWLSSCEKFINNHEIFETPFASHIFQNLCLIAPERAKNIISKLLADKNMEDIALLMCGSRSDSTNGPYFIFKETDWENVIDLEKIRRLIDETPKEEITREEAKAVLEGFNSKGKYYFNGEFSPRADYG